LTNKDVEIPVTSDQIVQGVLLGLNYIIEAIIIITVIIGMAILFQSGGNGGGLHIGFGIGVLVAKNLMIRYMCFETYSFDSEKEKEHVRRQRELYTYHWHLLRKLIPYKIHLKE